MSERFSGTVKWFEGSYGFIAGDDGTDYFVSYRQVLMEGYRALSKGQRVSFIIGKDLQGRDQAANVMVHET